MADQEHTLNYVFLCGLVCNLINCGNVVGGMSQLSVALQTIPEESHSFLSPSAFPSAIPPSNTQVTHSSITFHKNKTITENISTIKYHTLG